MGKHQIKKGPGKERAADDDDDQMAILFDIAELKVIAEAGRRSDVTRRGIGRAAVTEAQTYNAGRVPVTASSKAEELQDELDRFRMVRNSRNEVVYTTGINAYSMMLLLNSQVKGPVQAGESYSEQPGLLPRLLEQRVPYTEGLDIFDDEGTQVHGWLLGELGPAYQIDKRGRRRPAADRAGLLLQPSGRILEFRVSNYGNGIYNTQQITEYDMSTQLPPSFIDTDAGRGHMGREDWVYERLCGWDSKLHDGMGRLALEAEYLAQSRGAERKPGKHARLVDVTAAAPEPPHIPDPPAGRQYGAPDVEVVITPDGQHITEIHPRLAEPDAHVPASFIAGRPAA